MLAVRLPKPVRACQGKIEMPRLAFAQSFSNISEFLGLQFKMLCPVQKLEDQRCKGQRDAEPGRSRQNDLSIGGAQRRAFAERKTGHRDQDKDGEEELV